MTDDRAVHLHHCGQDEYEGSCKYGEDDTCPALNETGTNERNSDGSPDSRGKAVS